MAQEGETSERSSDRPLGAESAEVEASLVQALESVLYGEGAAPQPAPVEAAASSAPVGDLDPAPAATRGAREVDLIWAALVAAEEARWQRYGRPCIAVRLEIVGGNALADHLGDGAAERVVAVLDRLLDTGLRSADHHAKRSRWEHVLLLPETDPVGAAAALARLRDAFAAAMGPSLTVHLAFGIAEPSPGGTLAVAYHQAGRDLGQDRRTSPSGPGADRIRVKDITDPTQPLAVGDRAEPASRSAGDDIAERLTALDRLLADGLITTQEHADKRHDILDRL